MRAVYLFSLSSLLAGWSDSGPARSLLRSSVQKGFLFEKLNCHSLWKSLLPALSFKDTADDRNTLPSDPD